MRALYMVLRFANRCRHLCMLYSVLNLSHMIADILLLNSINNQACHRFSITALEGIYGLNKCFSLCKILPTSNEHPQNRNCRMGLQSDI